jgi:predicted alpha/beta-hydrolase family hydrolase
MLEIETALGPARAHLWSPRAGRRAVRPVGRLVLGHGAGGGIGAADLSVAREVAVAAGGQVVLMEQPWRVAGKRVAPAPARLDVGWLAVLAELRARWAQSGSGDVPLVVGGRSAGARVACRTAMAVGARAVCCFAFPLHPPGRPERSRAPELAAAGVPVLVLQGERDPFGGPAEVGALGLEHVEVVGVPGDHSLARSAAGAAALASALSRRLTGCWQE